MRVMIVDPGHDFSTLAIAESYTRAFERLGYEVVEYDLLKSMRIIQKGLKESNQKINFYQFTEMTCAPIVSQVIIDSIDAMIVIHGFFVNPAIVQAVRKTGCKTAVVLTDDPMEVDVSSQFSCYYDYVFTNEKNTVNRHKNCNYLPVAVDETIFYPRLIETRYRAQILVANSFYKERFDFIQNPMIKDVLLKYNTKFLGARCRDFDDEELNNLFVAKKITYEELGKYTANADIVVDINRDEFAPNSKGEANKEKIKASCVSPRVFECIASKALCITTLGRDGLYDFIPKELTVVVNNHEDFVNKMEFYISDFSERYAITEKLYNEYLQQNTYVARAKKIEMIMGLAVSVRNRYIGTLNNKIVNRWQDKWNENYVYCKRKNIYSKERSIEFFKDSYFQEKFVNIVSNGPSLEETMNFVDYEKICFYLNDALRLAQRKLCGDYAVVIHPNDDVYERCYKDIGIEGITLIASTLACPKVIDKWIDDYQEVLFFNSAADNEIKKQVIKDTGYPVFSSGLSVVYSACVAAIYMGFRELNLFGLDFCYLHNKKYFGKDLMDEEIDRKQWIVTKDKLGKAVLTDQVLLRSRDSLLNLIESNPDIGFNVYGRGILYKDGLKNLHSISG